MCTINSHQPLIHCFHRSLPYLPHSHSDTLCHHTLEYIPQICIIITQTAHSLHKTMSSSAGSRRPTTQSVGLSPRSLTNSQRSVSHSATPLFLTQHDQPAWCCQISSAVLLSIISLPGVVRYPQLCYSASSDILSCVTQHHQISSAVLLSIISLPGVVRYPQLCYSAPSDILSCVTQHHQPGVRYPQLCYSASSDILSCVTQHHQPGVVRYPQLSYSASSACLVLSDILSCLTQHHQPGVVRYPQLCYSASSAWCCQISSAVLLSIISLPGVVRYPQLSYSASSDILSCVTEIIRYPQLFYSASSDILCCVTQHQQISSAVLLSIIRYPQLCYSTSSACLVLSDIFSCVSPISDSSSGKGIHVPQRQSGLSSFC